MPVPPQFLPGYVPKSKTAAPTTAPVSTSPTGPKKFVPTKKPAGSDSAAQKAKDATTLSGILKANGIDPKTAATILSQFKAAGS